jgi:ATP-dependent DNA helicase PIF1
MCLDQSPESGAFANWLLDVGAGKHLDESGQLQLLPNMVLPDNHVDHLVDFVYPGISEGDKLDSYFLDRTILSPRNDAVDDLNHKILSKFPGESTTLHSKDKVIGEDLNYPIEYLNSINIPGLPLAHLPLKPGCPLMLLRNIDPLQGLCNGTRMVLIAIKQRVLQCRILGGSFSGNTVFIPRITIDPSSEESPIAMSRHQFPVRLAFAMTINKAQGQSVKIVGLDLQTPTFSHGQLYVALSRCTSRERIKVLLPGGTKTTNVVYPEVLHGIV